MVVRILLTEDNFGDREKLLPFTKNFTNFMWSTNNCEPINTYSVNMRSKGNIYNCLGIKNYDDLPDLEIYCANVADLQFDYYIGKKIDTLPKSAARIYSWHGIAYLGNFTSFEDNLRSLNKPKVLDLQSKIELRAKLRAEYDALVAKIDDDIAELQHAIKELTD